jgi:hypothetical protein
MTQNKPAGPDRDAALENPRVLGWAGGALFALGLAAFFLTFVQDDINAKINMVLYAALLLALGYPMLLYVRTQARVAGLEERIRRLEQGAPERP